MNICIDARFCHVKIGFGRYVSELIKQYAKLDQNNRYFLLLHPDANLQPLPNNFKIIRTAIPWYGLKEQTYLVKLLNKLPLDLVHFPHFNIPYFYTGKYVVTIHDLILMNYPSKKSTIRDFLTYGIKDKIFKKILNQALKKSERIIAVSNFTKQDIIKFFPSVNKNKIHVSYLSSFSGLQHQISSDLGSNFLYVGNAYPHKNLPFLIDSFRGYLKSYNDCNNKLIFVGREDFFYRNLKKFVTKDTFIKNNIEFLGTIDDENLIKLYLKSRALVMPSLYEGFGLPGLEAMSVGLPVLSSTAAALSEIYGGAALYFNPHRKDDLIKAFRTIVNDSMYTMQLKKRGFDQATKYNWELTAKKHLNIYLNTNI